jgi:hypothetical protein
VDQPARLPLLRRQASRVRIDQRLYWSKLDDAGFPVPVRSVGA